MQGELQALQQCTLARHVTVGAMKVCLFFSYPSGKECSICASDVIACVLQC